MRAGAAAAVDARLGAPIGRIEARLYRVPTEAPESDGTLAWDATTVLVVRAEAGGARGLGYSYTTPAAAAVVRDLLTPAVRGLDTGSVPRAATAMARAVRNAGRPGIASAAISAVDVALWDLAARLLDAPLAAVLGRSRDRVPVYGSGGFTSYTLAQLERQLAGWAGEGIGAVKMKVGRDPAADPRRIEAARRAVGDRVRLMIDANGGYTRAEALRIAGIAADLGVSWFEEPVSADDLAGLRWLRERAPAGMEIAAGEYGSTPFDFRRWIEAGAVDVLQADATRCGGASGFAVAAALCAAAPLPLSAHTAPSLHATLCCAAGPARDVEYFHDHVRVERLLFDGAREAAGGAIAPDWSRPGLGLELREADAEEYRL